MSGCKKETAQNKKPKIEEVNTTSHKKKQSTNRIVDLGDGTIINLDEVPILFPKESAVQDDSVEAIMNDEVQLIKNVSKLYTSYVNGNISFEEFDQEFSKSSRKFAIIQGRKNIVFANIDIEYLQSLYDKSIEFESANRNMLNVQKKLFQTGKKLPSLLEMVKNIQIE